MSQQLHHSWISIILLVFSGCLLVHRVNGNRYQVSPSLAIDKKLVTKHNSLPLPIGEQPTSFVRGGSNGGGSTGGTDVTIDDSSSSVEVTIDNPPPPPPPPPPVAAAAAAKVTIDESSSSSVEVSIDDSTQQQITNEATTVTTRENEKQSLISRLMSKLAKNLKFTVTSGEFSTSEIFFTLLGVGVIPLSCIVIMLDSDILVDILAICCIILGPTAAILKRKVGLLGRMRELNTELDDKVKQVKASNADLKRQNNRHAKNIKRLQKVEESLAKISGDGGKSIDKLIKQIDEYKEIQKQIKNDLKNKIETNIFNVLMESDRNENFILDDNEMNRVCTRLKNIPGVTFNERKFRSVIKKEGGDIMEFTNKYLHCRHEDHTTIHKDGIFKY